MFADDLSIYKDVSTTADCALLQQDLDSIVQWSKRWQLQLNCGKCEALNVSNKRSPLLYTYTISSQPLRCLNILSIVNKALFRRKLRSFCCSS